MTIFGSYPPTLCIYPFTNEEKEDWMTLGKRLQLFLHPILSKPVVLSIVLAGDMLGFILCI